VSIAQVTDLGSGHTLEYFTQDGSMRVKENRNGHVLDMTLTEFLIADQWEIAKYIALKPDYPSVIESNLMKRSSP
jgi:hypothetical protein